MNRFVNSEDAPILKYLRYLYTDHYFHDIISNNC